MNEQDIRNKIESSGLVMRCKEGFYIIDMLSDVPLEKQAKDNGELNSHVLSVETVFGKTLWTRDGTISRTAFYSK